MADKVAGTLSTKIKLDSTEATSSLKELNTSISASVAQMKSLEQQFKSQGDTAGALRSKIEGLGDVQDQLRKKLQTLKNAQQDVADSQGKSSDAYQKLATQITKTETTISRYQTQMDKAKQSLQYYDSGLAELKQSYSDQQRLSQSLVERLRAEGNSYQANVEEINGLKSALSNLKKQYDIQEQELADIAEKSGEASSAYKKQATRLNETATQIAQTESKQKSLTNSLEESTNAAKKSSSGFSSLGTKISDGTSKVSSFTSGIKSTAIGVGLANTAMAAMNLVTGQVGDAVQRVDTLANSKRVFQNMGYSAQDTDKAMKGLNKSIEGLPTGLDEAVQGVQMVASTTNDLGKAQKIWSALNDGIIGFGGSTENVQNAVTQLSQAFSNGKIDAETWNSMMDSQLGPTLNAIAKDMGMTTAQLKSGLSDGTISVQKFQDELIKLDTQGGGGLKSLSTIAKDSTSGISTAFQNMKTAITRGLGDLITNFSNGLQKVTGSNLSQLITKFGQVAEKALKTLGNSMSNVVSGLKQWQPVFESIGKVISAAFSGLSPIIDFFRDSLSKAGKEAKTFEPIIKTLSTVFNALAPVVKTLSNLIGNTLVVAWKAQLTVVSAVCSVINTAVGWVSKLHQGFEDFAKNTASKFNESWQSMKSKVGTAVKAMTDDNSKLHDNLVNKMSDAMGVSKKTVNDGFKTMEDSVKLFKDLFTGKWDQLGSDAKRLTKDMSATLKDIFNDMKESLGNKANELKDNVKEKFNDLKDKAKDKFEDMKESLKSKFEDMKSSLTDKAATLRDKVTDKFNTMKDNVKSKIQDLSDSAKTKFSDMYDTLKTKTSEGLKNIRKSWEKLWQSVINGIKSAVKNVGKQVANLVNNVIKPINKMLDGVKDGVNWVLDKFGAKKWSGWKIPEVAFAKGGTVGKGGTMALVNDAPGKNYREMFATPDGRVGAFPDQRNFRTFLPEGTQVLDGENSRALADMMNIPKFADGTEDKSLFAKIFDKAWDIAENIADVIAHPVQFLEKTLTDKIKINTNVQFASKMAAKAPAYFAKQGMNWLKKMAEDFKKKKEEESSVAGVDAKNIGAGAKNWTDTIKKVAKAMKVDLSESDINLILWRINKESGGNQSIKQQVWDINMANGNPAQGLLQYVPSTFAAWMVSGHNNILSGEDQLYAMFNDSNWRQDIANSGGWGPTGHRRFANGGFVDSWTNAVIGEAGPEVVIPLSANKQGRALDLLTTTVNKLNNNAGRSTRVVSGTTSTESDLSAKLDTMIGLLSSILGVNQAQLTKASQKGNLTAFYQQMQRDQAINNYQSI